MKKIALSLAVAVSALTFSGAAEAQQKSAVLVVDTDRVLNECTACKSEASQLQGQIQQFCLQFAGIFKKGFVFEDLGLVIIDLFSELF